MVDPRSLKPEALARLFADVFETDLRGRACLEYLERRYCAGDAVVTDGGIDAVLKTYRKAAHRELLDHIHMQIGRANGETSSPTPEALTD